MARRLLAVALALLLAVQVVRNSAVAALADRQPDEAARIWAGHPDVETALGMTEIGRAARERRPVPPSVFSMMQHAAAKAPLDSEPFLVRGVAAQLSGNAPLAIEAFTAAERRDPRSLPAHYFLADALFRSGDMGRGLAEVAVLARLAPNGLASLAPYVAAYAKDRSHWPQLREMFKANADIEEAALDALSTDHSNADIVMALADEAHKGPTAIWLPGLLNSLVVARDYEKARDIWASTLQAKALPGATIYDAGFSDAVSPAPFNWTLMSSTVGLAERQPGGRLHVIFYGREDGWLARQLLLLKPGSYRMAMSAAGNAADARSLSWSIRCDPSQTPFAAIPVDVAASRSWTFAVPENCPAQWLELSGVSSDVARQSEVTISNLHLAAGGPHG